MRIEDIDLTRVRPYYVQAIFDYLHWLGLTWEEPVLFQSQHLDDYKAAAGQLAKMGLVYPCFATRADIMAAGQPRTDPDGGLVYPGLWRGRAAHDVDERMARGEPFAVRLDMERAIEVAQAKLRGAPLEFTEISADGSERRVRCHPERWGDVVILRKETPSSYLIAVVVDDARQGITHVTRGMDLFAATQVQRLLQVLLDLPEPVYHHHRLIADEAGLKLSKSTGAQSLAALRENGLTPADIRRLIGLQPA